MAESLGGFFLHLGVKTDNQSFNAGHQALQGFENAAKNVTKALGITTGSMFTMAKAAGVMESASIRTSRAIGISTAALDSWKISAGIAGTSASGLAAAMQQVENKMQRIKTGQVDMTMATNLARLNIGYSRFADMNADERMRSVFGAAGAMKDQRLAATLVGDTLGQSAREYYEYLQLSGKSLDRQLAEGRALNFTNEATKKQALIFNSEFNAVAQAGKSIAMFFGSNLAGQLTPAVTSMKQLLISNRELIQSGIVGFTENLGRGIRGIVGVGAKIKPYVTELIDKFGGLDKMIIKLGVGVGALKLANFAGGLLHAVQGINLLKMTLSGIGRGLFATGLYLFFDDLMVYMTGGDSVLGSFLETWKKVQEDFNPASKLEQAVRQAQKLFEIMKKIFTGDFSDYNEIADIANEGIDTSTTKGKIIAETNKIGAAVLTNQEMEYINDSMDALTDKAKENFIYKIPGIKQIHNYKEKKNQEKLDATQAAAKIKNESDLQAAIDSRWWEDSTNNGITTNKQVKINDGIIRPDGTVTQVAPDDWVLAARSLGDMAAAFTPSVQNTTNAPTNYVVTQNITINGSRDIAQSVRQQAYQGATQGLQQTIQHSQRILQSMPGQR